MSVISLLDHEQILRMFAAVCGYEFCGEVDLGANPIMEAVSVWRLGGSKTWESMNGSLHGWQVAEESSQIVGDLGVLSGDKTQIRHNGRATSS